MLWVFLLLAALLHTAYADAYTYVTVDLPFPGATGTMVTGLNTQNTLVGMYNDAHGRAHGFLSTPTHLSLLLNVVPRGITDQGVIAGTFGEQSLLPQRGFLLTNGTFRVLEVFLGKDNPKIVRTDVPHIGPTGGAVGTYEDGDGVTAGFIYTPTNDAPFARLAVAGALATAIAGRTTAGVLVGSYLDSAGEFHAFRVDAGTVNDVVVPGHVNVMLVGLTDSGILAGNALNAHVGFLLENGTLTLIQVPGSTQTVLGGIREDGTVYGRYADAGGVVHGFVATPGGAGEMITAGSRVKARPQQGVERGDECQGPSPRWECRPLTED